jgi:hypothetical protein
MSNEVTYDIVINATITIDAVDLIVESARSLIEGSFDVVGDADIHDIDITSA